MPGRTHQVELVEADDEPERSRSGPAPQPRPTSWSRRPGPRVEVALDEDDAGEPSDGVLAARSWLRRHARWIVPTAATLAVALVGTQVALDRREAARMAALAAVPGVLPPTDASIGVIWRAEPALSTALESGVMVDGLLVGGTQDETGAPSIVGLDPDTGVVAWTTALDLPTPQPTPASASPELWISCHEIPLPGGATSPVAACVSQEYGEGVQGTPAASVWVLDPADGGLLADRVVDGESGLTFTDDAVVVTGPVAGAGAPRWDVTATDPVSGDTLWTWTTPVPEEPTAAGSASLQTHGDRVMVAVDGHAWILTTDGVLVRDVPLGQATWLQPARSGAFIESTWTSSDLYEGVLLLEDGTEVPVDQTAGWLSVDDGSAPDVLFTVGNRPDGLDGLSGRSARTGEELWRLEESVVTSLLLDGILYAATTDALHAIDAATGDALWRTRLDHPAQQMSTDGQYLLVPGLGVTLHAFSMRDGRLEWSTDLAEEVAGDRSTVFVQGFRTGTHDPRLWVWMVSGSVAVLG